MNEPIEDLLADVRRVAPQVVGYREIAAVIESFGYDDRSAKDLGFPDVFALAKHLCTRFSSDPAPEEDAIKNSRWTLFKAEASRAVRKLSLGLAYVVPWAVLLVLQYLRPDALQVSPELGGALSLALIASLITTGGFIQMISRSGNFYYGMEEPFVARSTCMLLLNLGLISTLLFAMLGLVLSLYFHLFPSSYLTLAAIEYVALSLLWMFCAVLAVQGLGWCIPLMFVLSAFVIGLIKMLTNCGTIAVLVLWPALAVLGAIGCMLAGFRRAEKKNPGKRESASPRHSVWFVSLLPFYGYGAVYFSFLFADRMAAGSAIPWISGLSFGIDSSYQRGMDLVLLAFLITAALVEYLSDSFLRFWRQLAAENPRPGSKPLVASLRQRHWRLMLATGSVFIAIAASAWFVFCHFTAAEVTPRLWQTSVMGGLGYLLLSMALLEIIILASVNSTSAALLAVTVGLGVNVLTGYGLSHLLGSQYAAAGLLAGSAVVLWRCTAAVSHILRHPDYHYAIS